MPEAPAPDHAARASSAPPPPPPPPPAASIFALAAVSCFGLFASLATRPAGLFDADSYFHLAVARLYREQGIVAALPWTRFSLMAETHGDKELLFHLLLVPATFVRDLELGGQLALAGIATALALSLAYLASRVVGPRMAAFTALFVMGTSATFALRLFRLRPELLSLLFMLWTAHFLIRRRYLLATLTSAAFCMSHTGVHSLLALSLVWAAQAYLAERELDLRMLLAVFLGVAAGFVLHPHFPDNLHVFWAQNVSLFEHRAALDIGAELDAFTTATALQLDGFWLLGMLVLWAARTEGTAPSASRAAELRRGARVFGAGALAFGVLFLHMGRFALYFVPLATLALLYALAARGLRVGQTVPLPLLPALPHQQPRRLPTVPVLVVSAALGMINVAATLYLNLIDNGAWTGARGQELRALARALPDGAKVAAHWSNAEDYVFYAPRARYLNVLNPLFMYLAHPDLQRLWDGVLRGDEPDVPERLVVDLDSDYIAFAASQREALLERLDNDPRLELLHAGRERLFRVRRDRSARFVTAWQVLPDAQPQAGGASAAVAARSYPAQRSPRGQGLAGYVDATRLPEGRQACLRFVHERTLTAPLERWLELAPWGPASLSIDGQLAGQVAAPQRARLGAGVALPVRLPPGRHRFEVRTCPHAGKSGFYLIDRGRL